MIDRYLLRYFLAVIDQGNFSKAAFQSGVSQPTLSVGIAKLERELGRPLFRRTNRRVEVTEAGAHFAAHARRIEAEFALAERRVRESEIRTPIRLGILMTIPSRWIETLLVMLKTEAPDERIELVEGSERDLLDHLNRRRIDMALTILREESPRLASEPLFTEGYTLAMAANHPLAGRKVISAEELADNVMIVRRQCELLSETSRYFTRRGVRPFFAARTMNDDRALAYVRAGLGVTVTPSCYAEPGIAMAALRDFGFTRNIGILYGPDADQPMLREGRLLTALVNVVGKNRDK